MRDKFPTKRVRRDEINGTNKKLETIKNVTRTLREYQHGENIILW